MRGGSTQVSGSPHRRPDGRSKRRGRTAAWQVHAHRRLCVSVRWAQAGRPTRARSHRADGFLQAAGADVGHWNSTVLICRPQAFVRSVVGRHLTDDGRGDGWRIELRGSNRLAPPNPFDQARGVAAGQALMLTGSQHFSRGSREKCPAQPSCFTTPPVKVRMVQSLSPRSCTGCCDTSPAAGGAGAWAPRVPHPHHTRTTTSRRRQPARRCPQGTPRCSRAGQLTRRGALHPSRRPLVQGFL
jgi:hypothetical protein